MHALGVAMFKGLTKHILVLTACFSLAAQLAWAQTAPKATNPPGVVVRDPVVYDVVMTTTMVIPAGDHKFNQLNVWHALPGLRAWSDVAGPVGASDIKWSPGGKQQYTKEHDAHHVL